MKNTIKTTHAYKGETIYELLDDTFETRLEVGGPLGVLVTGHGTLEDAKKYLDSYEKLQNLKKK